MTKWIVLAVWIVLAAGGGIFAGKLSTVLNNEAQSWIPASAESSRALEKMTAIKDPNVIPTAVVYEITGDGVSAEDLARIQAEDAARFATDLDLVTGEVLPLPVSEDGKASQTIVQFDIGVEGWEQMPDIAKEIKEISSHDGIATYVAGMGGQTADQASAFGGLETSLLFWALVAVVVILLFAYRSPVLWLLPIVSALVGLMTSMGLVYLLARYADLTVNAQSQAILGILVIGAGTDYALLLIARYREELRNYEDRHEAMAHALHRAAPAILASAATVILGILCLLLAEMNSTKGLGPVVAVGIAVTYLVMVTLLPALLVILGRWQFWPKRPAFGSAEPTQLGIWSKVGNAVSVRPRTVWIGTTVLLGIACLGLFRLEASGLTIEDTFTNKVDSVTGQHVLEEHGLADESNTVMVVANADKIDEVVAALGGIDGLGPAGRPSPPFDGMSVVEAPLFGDVAAQSTFDVVRDVRDRVHDVDGADALVGGGAAFYLDTKDAATRDGRVIIPAVLLVVFLVLVMLLRAVVAPLILLATVILSFGAALGLSALLFEYVLGFNGSSADFPLFAFVFLVALGIDYNIFLMTRVREESVHRGTRAGALVGLTSTGGVITSAGLVLAATFLVLGTLPLVMMVELGVAVALGVILDTMIVRSILVTAINLDLGEKIWWPSKVAPTSLGTDPDDAGELVNA